MKKVMAVTAGFLVAFAPTGSAFAGVPDGNAFGNCKNSASGGKTVLDGSTLTNDSGLGGFRKGAECKVVEEASTGTVVVIEPAPPTSAEDFS